MNNDQYFSKLNKTYGRNPSKPIRINIHTKKLHRHQGSRGWSTRCSGTKVAMTTDFSSGSVKPEDNGKSLHSSVQGVIFPNKPKKDFCSFPDGSDGKESARNS